MITGNFYYVDKTWMIKELIDKKNEVNLFARPRRFGKTLNMSMLRYFFEDTGNSGKTRQNARLFEGLRICEAGGLYRDVEKPPVILELKVSETYKGMADACEKALAQIKGRQYDRELPEEGYAGVWNYGIAFFRKQCMVRAEYKEF